VRKTGLEIRLSKPEDYEEMGEVFRRSIRDIASQDYDSQQIAAWSAHADNKITWAERMRRRMNLLAIKDDRIIGFVQYDPPDHVDMTYVHPEYQRLGVATALLYRSWKWRPGHAT
jgi:putative acetyltransferase